MGFFSDMRTAVREGIEEGKAEAKAELAAEAAKEPKEKPEKPPKEKVVKTPKEKPEKPPKEKVVKTPKEKPENPPKEKVVKTPKEKPEKPPKEKVAKTPKEKPEKPPKEKVAKTPKEKPENPPKKKVVKTPKVKPEKALKEKPVKKTKEKRAKKPKISPDGSLELYSDDELNAIEAHIDKYYGEATNIFHEIVSPDIHLDVAIIEPTPERNYYTLVTEGAGAHIQNVPEDLIGYGPARIELLTCLPPDWDIHSSEEDDYWPIGSLKAMGRYALEHDTWLGFGHTVQFGEPLGGNSDLAGYMLMNPIYHYGESEENPAAICKIGNGKDGTANVVFYQLLPLYDSEMYFKIKHDAETLLEKFREAIPGKDIGILDIGRPSVI